MNKLRTLLILGRASNLPTVWSNCLAGWWLGSKDWDLETKPLPLLLAGATLLYIGGMYLNDAFDANFDAQFRRERPIPSGAISERAVWLTGFGLLAAGLACLAFLGMTTAILGVLLVACIVLYDAVHKMITISPVLMAACRFFLYLVAASTGSDGVTGAAVWCGLALGAYIVGLSYVAGKESTRMAVRYWPCVFLGAPVILALFMNTGDNLKDALLLSAVLGLWIVRQLRYTFGASERNIGRTVSGLLAGIPLVDLLAVADVPHPFAAVFLALLLLALVFQRFIPAT
ncbi:MAG TPA: UbiA family prenyltransferase [Verrucomicrobiae bacterium]|nr:UbiA family prenyltransferase [Verrucomicrobiae bacterium]